MIVRTLRPHRCRVVSRRLGVRVRVERRLANRSTDSSHPPAGADALVRVAFDHDVVRTVWNSARMQRSGTPRESGAGEIESAPPEMRRARLADEASAKFLENAIGVHKNLPEPMDRLRLIRCMRVI